MPSYGYVENDKIIAPISMCSRYKGVGAWHLLTYEQRAAYGCIAVWRAKATMLPVRPSLGQL